MMTILSSFNTSPLKALTADGHTQPQKEAATPWYF
jgi:hypothetical protein